MSDLLQAFQRQFEKYGEQPAKVFYVVRRNQGTTLEVKRMLLAELADCGLVPEPGQEEWNHSTLPCLQLDPALAPSDPPKRRFLLG